MCFLRRPTPDFQVPKAGGERARRGDHLLRKLHTQAPLTLRGLLIARDIIKSMDNIFTLVFQLAVLIFSVMIHEISHGIAALKLGDTTARDAGRLTMNPLKHLDMFGSILLPISLFLLSGGSFVIGWAKPVPYNPNNLKNPRMGSGIIGATGPLSNLIIAAVFGLLLRFAFPYLSQSAAINLLVPLSYIVFINVLLAIFNLVPLPPLDGSNILFALLPRSFYPVQRFLNRYGFILLLLFIFFGFQILVPIVLAVYKLLAGPAALL